MLQRPLLAGLGFAAFAASLMLHDDTLRLLVALVATPVAAVVAIVTLLPALYLTSNAFAPAPPLTQLVSATRGTLEDAGILLLGFAPAAAFLVSSWGAGAVWLVAGAMLFVATRVASAAFHRRYAVGRVRVAGWMCLVTAMTLTLLGRWLAF